MEINKKSWHYRLATAYGPMSTYRDELDICRYIRSVLIGSLIACIVASGLGSAIASISVFVMHVLMLDGNIEDPIAVAGLFLVIILVTILSVVAATEVKEYVERNYVFKKKEATLKKPGLLKMAYRRFKEKTCFYVEFVE